MEPLFDRPVFHEQALRLPAPTADILRSLAAHGLLGGYDLSRDYPELGDAVLVCATELRTEEDLDNYKDKLARTIAARGGAKCRLQPKI